jgi:phosphomannomutase
MNYVFDVDGTLTPSRGKIDDKFADFFLEFCHRQDVYLVSGSDYKKTQEQLGDEICHAARLVFSCSSNVIYKHGILVVRNDFVLLPDERDTIMDFVRGSGFTEKVGPHIEQRIGTVNASVVGRDCTPQQRADYIAWDLRTNERKHFVNHMNFVHGQRIEAVVGGETGIDIYLRGHNKSNVRKYLAGPITFFGDRCELGGNDWPLAKVADHFHFVRDWQQTYEIMKLIG